MQRQCQRAELVYPHLRQPTIMPLELPEPLGPKLFIWGEPVLRKYYTVYDWQDQQIGFALAKHMPSEVSADEEAKQLRGRGLLFA
ncbi:Plasmepsin-2 [Symbiodinium microadriaticum]|uniref:Plasmepsin-2 n=1 Tax=Symbiodinium microadriaticum TaxID=2951 RepID=A0A1Q9E8G0_SYMMI|nr:Plasmepsin-2 [Symbiodinium microadriaticum]